MNIHSCFRIAWSLVTMAAVFSVSPAPAADPTDPQRPAAIEAKDVPPLPAELVERLRQYQNIRSAQFYGWAPDGSGVLVGTRFGNSTQLHRVYEPGGRREQITFFEEPVGGRFLPGTDGAILVLMSKGGDENGQIYRWMRGGVAAKLLTDGKSRNLLGPVSQDGRQMVFGSNRRNGRDTDWYVADPRSADEPRKILEVKNETWSALDLSRDGRRLLMEREVSINESYPAILDLGSNERRDFPKPEGPGPHAFGILAFAPDGQSAYVTCDAKGEFRQLARVDLKSFAYTWLTSDIPWDVDGVEVEPNSGLVAFTVNEQGTSTLYLLEGDKRRAIELPPGVVSTLKFSPDGKRLGFTLARSDLPDDVYSINVVTSALVRWTYSEVGGLAPQGFVSPTRIEYPTFDGRKIPAFYFRPKAARESAPAGVVIQIHGGPESQYQPVFSDSTQFYVGSMGLAVIAPNVRGSAGYGKSYLKLDNGALREDSVRDIGALLDWIAKQPELDASRVAVTGGSYGGYMVLASLTHFPDRLKAGVDIVGIANFITFLERTSPYRQDLRRVEYGDERNPEMRRIFERINPTSSADKIRSALLVAHGLNDPRVPASESEQIAARVRSAGRTVWTVYAQNEGHGFRKKDNRDYLAAVIALFLESQLKPR